MPGGLFDKLGQGVGMAVEYHQHRKQQKSMRSTSQGPGEASNAADAKDKGARRQTPSPGISPSPYDRASSPYHLEKKQISNNTSPGFYDRASSPYDSEKKQMSNKTKTSSFEDDDADRDLDEDSYSDDPPSYEDSEKSRRSSTDLAREVVSINRKSAIQGTFTRRPIPCPVIIPQRRPGSRGRGFLRAYAPVLGEYAGIDQETFLSFLKNFHKASQASPIFGIIQISAGIAGFAPGVTAMIVTTAASAAAEQGAKMQERSRTDNFLDKMNKELFMPAGLFALIVQYQSEADQGSMLGRYGVGATTTGFDANQAHGGNSFSRQNFGAAAGTTQGSVAMPKAAPLIIPEVKPTLDHEGPETFKDKTKDFKKFMGGYMDRKAQQKYAQQNPDSSLVLPEQQQAVKSSYSDPNRNGGLLGSLSGGQLSRDRVRGFGDGGSGQAYAGSFDDYDEGRRRDRRNERQHDRRRSRSRDRKRDRKEDRGEKGGLRGAMKEGVLYLLIVNMPSERELALANRRLGM